MANDFFNIPNNALSNQVFYSKGGTDFEIWSKPANAKFISIFCLGSGAGGGGGTAGTATTARKGGGGGGSGAYSLGFFSASQLPDTLFIQTAIGGSGGLGGASSANGVGGSLSYICVQPNTTTINILMQSGAIAPTFGQAGASGTGGTGGTIWSGGILNSLGFATATAGVNGTSGAISTPGADVTITSIISGGASGGNTSTAASFIGGSILGAGFVNTISGGALGAGATAGGAGSDGYIANMIGNSSNRQPMFFTGGSGGGASVSGQGGVGGAGAYGSGGGGGGAGFTALAGAGGRGGDGLIIITCF